MSKADTNKRFRLGDVLGISLAHLVHDIYSSFLAPILPLLIEKFSLSYSMAAVLNVVQRAPSLLNPFVGMIADRLPVRYFLIWAPAITSVSMSLLGAAPHYIALVVLLLFMGIGATLFHVPAPVMVKRIAGDRTGTGMSFYMFGGEIARTVAPMVILGAVSLWGLEGTYRLIPFGLLASFMLHLKIRNIHIAQALRTDHKLREFGQTFMDMLPFFLLLLGFTLLRSIMKAALTTFLPTFITAKGQSIWMGGISLSIVQLAGAVGTFLGGSISDKIGRKNTLLIISITSPFLMWLFVISEGVYTISILIVLGFLMIAPSPVLLALVQDQDSRHPSFVNGVYMTINFVIGAVAVVFIGVLGDWIGLIWTYKISAILAVFTIPFLLKFPEKRKKTG